MCGTNFAADPAALAKQTRIDQAFFQYGEAGRSADRFPGCLHLQGKTPMPDLKCPRRSPTLEKAGCKRKASTASSWRSARSRRRRTRARNAEESDRRRLRRRRLQPDRLRRQGRLLRELPLVPAGQEANIRKLIDEARRRIRIWGGFSSGRMNRKLLFVWREREQTGHSVDTHGAVMYDLSWLIGYRFGSFVRNEFNWTIAFDGQVTITIDCPWRLLQDGEFASAVTTTARSLGCRLRLILNCK